MFQLAEEYKQVGWSVPNIEHYAHSWGLSGMVLDMPLISWTE